MKTNRKVTTRRNSSEPQRRKDGSQKTIPDLSVTENEQTERLRNQLAAIVESSDDAIIGKTLDGIITSWNEGARRIYGYGAEEALGRQISILIPPDLKDELPSILKRLGKGERIDHYETARLRKDGQRIDVSLTISPIRDSAGNIIGASTIARDITDRKQAEEALAKEQHEMQIIMNYLPAKIYFKDLASRFTGISKSHALRFGLNDPAQAIGKTDFDFFTTEHAQQAFEDEQAIIRTGQTLIKEEKETWIDRPDTWVSTIKMPMRDTEGNIIGTFGLSIDITDRKQAEEALHASETRYRLLVEASPDAVTQTDMNGKILMCNMQAAILLGYEHPDELIGQSVFGLVPPDELERASANIRKTLEDGIVRNVEYRLVKKDGSQFPAELSAALIRDAAGKPVTFMALTHDITKRKRAEKVVVEERNLLLTLINNLPDRIYVKDIQGRKTISNTADWRALGEKRMEGVIGKTDFDTYPAELATRFWADDKMVLDSGKPVINREEPHLDWQDNLTWTLTTKVPLRDDNGQVVGLVGIGRDITERKQVEERLRENEAMYRLLFDSAPMGILLVDAQGNILEVNPAALQILGSPSAEATKEINLLTFQPLIEAGISADFQKGIDSAQPAIAEYPYTTKWGKSVFITLRFTPLFGANGNLEQIQVIMEDITERKQAEAKIQQQLHRLSALRDIDLVIKSNFDLQVTLNILLGHVTAQLGVDAAAVLLFRQSMNELEFAAGRGFHTANITRLRLKLGEEYSGRAALERRTIAISNLEKSQEPFDTKFIEGEGFVTFFAVPLIAKGKVKGVLEVFHRSLFQTDADWLNFLEALAGQAAIAIDNSELFGNLQQSNLELQLAYDKTIEGWSRALDLRDKETEGHTQRVTKAALRLAEAMGLGNDELIQVRRGALLHDIGKMGVPDHILLKPGDLTEEESAAMRKHPQFAFDLFSSIDFLRPALDIPYGHHEKWDGTGYPRGLKGEQIPLTARIFAIVDVYDAITSDRPYRPAWTKEKALEYIQSQAGKYFDPNVAQKFIEMIKKD